MICAFVLVAMVSDSKVRSLSSVGNDLQVRVEGDLAGAPLIVAGKPSRNELLWVANGSVVDGKLIRDAQVTRDEALTSKLRWIDVCRKAIDLAKPKEKDTADYIARLEAQRDRLATDDLQLRGFRDMLPLNRIVESALSQSITDSMLATAQHGDVGHRETRIFTSEDRGQVEKRMELVRASFERWKPKTPYESAAKTFVDMEVAEKVPTSLRFAVYRQFDEILIVGTFSTGTRARMVRLTGTRWRDDGKSARWNIDGAGGNVA